MLLAAVSCVAVAQVNPPCGVYEAADKVDGMSRQAYMEINMTDPVVPDFSQTFKKGELHKFGKVSDDFMKKPSQYFKGQKATAFVRYRSKAIIANTEVCRLSDPKRTAEGWTLTWTDDLGKKGTCTMYVDSDTTLYFIGLGSFTKGINPDKLRFVRIASLSAGKDYLTPKAGGGSDAAQPAKKPSASASAPKGGYTPKSPAGKPLTLPAANSGTLKGEWTGQNVDGSRIVVRLNAQARAYKMHGRAYYGTIVMDGPTYLEEGVVRICQVGQQSYDVYSYPLSTDDQSLGLSVVRVDDKNLYYNPDRGIEALTQMGRHAPLSEVIICRPLNPLLSGRYTTGNEVRPFEMDFYIKKYYDNGEGTQTEGYGCITSSFGGGMRIDNDVITEAKIEESGRVQIKYRCGRTGNVYKGTLSYNHKTKTFSVQGIVMVKDESEAPEMNDCHIPQIRIRQVSTTR